MALYCVSWLVLTGCPPLNDTMDKKLFDGSPDTAVLTYVPLLLVKTPYVFDTVSAGVNCNLWAPGAV